MLGCIESCWCYCPKPKVTNEDNEISIVLNDKKEAKGQDLAWIEGIDFSASRLSSRERERVTTLFKQFPHVFSKSDSDVRLTDSIKHKIDLVDKSPIWYPNKAIPHHLFKDIQAITQTWLYKGIIRESNSAYTSQIKLIMKNNRTLWVHVGFRGLNEMICLVSIPYQNGSIYSVLQRLRWFSVFFLYFHSVYHQVPLWEEDKEKTEFRVLSSLYEFERMPSGLYNAALTLSVLMDKAFGYHTAETLFELFLGDIIVHTTAIDQMIQRMNMWLIGLTSYGLKL